MGLGFPLQVSVFLAKATLSLRSLTHCGESLCQGCLSPKPLTQWQLRRDSAGGAGLAGGGGDRASQPPLPGHGVHVRDAVPFLLLVVLGLGSDKPGRPSVPSYMSGKALHFDLVLLFSIQTGIKELLSLDNFLPTFLLSLLWQPPTFLQSKGCSTIKSSLACKDTNLQTLI